MDFRCRRCGSKSAALKRIGPKGVPAEGWECMSGCGEQTLMTQDERVMLAIEGDTSNDPMTPELEAWVRGQRTNTGQ